MFLLSDLNLISTYEHKIIIHIKDNMDDVESPFAKIAITLAMKAAGSDA